MASDDTTARPAIGDDDVVVFSYGTLQDPAVQQGLFATVLPSTPDRIVGHRLEWITITDPDVVRLSGTDRHPIVQTSATGETVSGTALVMTPDQLRRADDYEVDDYHRIEVTLASGRAAWVYTRRPD